MRNIVVFFVIFLKLNISHQDQFFCHEKLTCDECIQQLGCGWTSNTSMTQCGTEGESNDEKPYSSTTIVENSPLSSNSVNPIQIRPQHIKISARRFESIDIDFQYKQAENYPVDLYFLMDLSASMETNRRTLADLGLQLAQGLAKITNNVRLGFGSFVDKVDLPFAWTQPEKLQNPCTTRHCEPPYSFKNHLSLTEVHKRFKDMVTSATVSGNIDAPEGGFDALMQVMVCKDQIGWRDKARRIIVFSTDDESHVAGDGKLAGVLEPNPGQCYMKDNQYPPSAYLKYDYPSVSQINYIAKENNINLIFAIVKPNDNQYILNMYEKIYREVENSKMGVLDSDGKNVVNLVLDNYNKIVDTVTITSNATEDIEVTITPKCANPKENGCKNVHVGELLDFSATIQPTKCVEGQNKKTIAIKPEGLKDSVIIELDVLCQCNCSNPDHPLYKKNAEECSRHGDWACGRCSCNSGRSGKFCECDGSGTDAGGTNQNKDEFCKREKSSPVCSGLGTCKCGKCECNARQDPAEKIYGQFCECNNFSCIKRDGLFCSGNGECDCGRCVCKPGWTGDACDCFNSALSCIAPGSNDVCSGHGTCECGACECNSDSKRYSGKFCEECPSCPAKKCNELKDCVECRMFDTGTYDKETCLKQCGTLDIEGVDKIDENSNEHELIKTCTVPDNSSCTIIFQYWYNKDNSLAVRAKKEKICPEPLNLIALIGWVIISILMGGIIMLVIWKVCTYYHDRRNYERFEKERAATKWHNNTNPLYRNATTTFQNPAYNRSVL